MNEQKKSVLRSVIKNYTNHCRKIVSVYLPHLEVLHISALNYEYHTFISLPHDLLVLLLLFLYSIFVCSPFYFCIFHALCGKQTDKHKS